MRVLAQKSPELYLEKKDWRILKEIISNIRQPLSQIAKKCLISRQSVEYRLKQLQNNHLIIGSRTIINTKKLGYKSYHIFVEVHTPQEERDIIEHALKSSHVNAIIVYSGKYNLEISIMAKDDDEFLLIYQTLTEKNKIRNDAILTLLSTIRSEVLPLNYFSKIKEDKQIEQITPKIIKPKEEKPLLAIDYKLLYALSQNATINNLTLAHQLKTSKDTIAYHIKNLEKENYIIQYRPIINYAVLNLSINSILIKINHLPKQIQEFETYLKTQKNILWATKTFGHYNYLIYIITKNLEEFHEVINEFKENFEDLIKTYEILFAFKELKYDFMAESILEHKK